MISLHIYIALDLNKLITVDIIIILSNYFYKIFVYKSVVLQCLTFSFSRWTKEAIKMPYISTSRTFLYLLKSGQVVNSYLRKDQTLFGIRKWPESSKKTVTCLLLPYPYHNVCKCSYESRFASVLHNYSLRTHWDYLLRLVGLSVVFGGDQKIWIKM